MAAGGGSYWFRGQWYTQWRETGDFSASGRSPAPAEPSPSAVFVLGFGCKGEGMDANDGVATAPSTLLAAADLPLICSNPAVLQGSKEARSSPQSEPLIPPPISATSEEIENRVSSCFRPLTNISTKSFPEVGESVFMKRC